MKKSPSRKKRILIGSGIVLVLVIVGAITLRLYLPVLLAKTISGSSMPAILPKKLQATITKIRKKVNPELERIPAEMAELGLSFEDLIYIIDHIDSDEVKAALKDLNTLKIITTDQAFDTVVAQVHVEGYDFERFRPVFNQKITVKKINHALTMIKDNNLMANMSVYVARETAKQILRDNREKIETSLQKIKREKN